MYKSCFKTRFFSQDLFLIISIFGTGTCAQVPAEAWKGFVLWAGKPGSCQLCWEADSSAGAVSTSSYHHTSSQALVMHSFRMYLINKCLICTSLSSIYIHGAHKNSSGDDSLPLSPCNPYGGRRECQRGCPLTSTQCHTHTPKFKKKIT